MIRWKDYVINFNQILKVIFKPLTFFLIMCYAKLIRKTMPRENKMSKLVIIRGNSGSGKTTLAKALQHKLGHNIMVISQDVIRRDILRVKDGEDTKALPLLSELLVYGKNNCDVVILEGILYSKWYMPLFKLAKKLFKNNILAFYYDLTFEETLIRHNTKHNKDDFGKEEMEKWWHKKDYIKIIPEERILEDISLTEAVEIISKKLC